MSLLEEIEKYAATVSTESYSMSVGELASMYIDGELIIRPEFQRFFRWEIEQKSRLIESLLLGIPIPPIYVSERDDSKWEVIDGLQRLSTIFETMGELKNEVGEKNPALSLTGTKYLPSLNEKLWASNKNGGYDLELPAAARIKIKRSRVDITIIKSTSDVLAKYEMFQRLNTGGSKATPQEVRNCIIIMNDPEFLPWMQKLASFDGFQKSVIFSEKQMSESYDLELITRFIVFVYVAVKSPDELKQIDELGDFLTDKLLQIIADKTFDREQFEALFCRVFSFLSGIFGENAFRKFAEDRGQYNGASLISIYEILAVGLGVHLLIGRNSPDDKLVLDMHRKLWNAASGDIGKYIGSGVRASTRIPETIEYGKGFYLNAIQK